MGGEGRHACALYTMCKEKPKSHAGPLPGSKYTHSSPRSDHKGRAQRTAARARSDLQTRQRSNSAAKLSSPTTITPAAAPPSSEADRPRGGEATSTDGQCPDRVPQHMKLPQGGRPLVRGGRICSLRERCAASAGRSCAPARPFGRAEAVVIRLAGAAWRAARDPRLRHPRRPRALPLGVDALLAPQRAVAVRVAVRWVAAPPVAALEQCVAERCAAERREWRL